MLPYYKKILQQFNSIPGIVIVYGSVATEHARPDSDIDLAIVSDDPTAKIQAEQIADAILLSHGRVVSIYFLSFPRLKKRIHEPFIQTILRGEILYGRKFLTRLST